MVQLWVNLPKAQKMSEPRYQAITKAQIPVIELEGGGHVRVIAGELLGRLGPASTFTAMNIFDVILKAGERFELPLPDGHNAAVVLRKGDVLLNGMDHLSGEALIAPLTEEGDSVTLEAKADTQLLILSGEPILEPVASYGPFVMNTREEIERAVDDYRAGRMGHLG
jgi:redox-sensitive bicupin YhaK (pirin superfamily)